MTWSVPAWWPFVLLALAAFRVWHLLAEDTILDRPRTAFVHRWPRADFFIRCPWCAGFWVTLGWWLAWVTWPHWTLVVATPFALSAVVAIVATQLDSD